MSHRAACEHEEDHDHEHGDHEHHTASWSFRTHAMPSPKAIELPSEA